ncbi:MAG: pirin family protein [Actinomycetota bacterium]
MSQRVTSLRPLSLTIESDRTVEGGGFVVRRPFPTARVSHIDPFLLLDEMGPVEYAPQKAIGAPEHPHRGFETVTYLMHGAMEHRDTTGAVATIRPGGVQWMTAGSGVIHSELPTDDFLRSGGRMHGFQLWVNLPANAKMIPPRYQGFEANELRRVKLPSGGEVRVVAGTVMGVTGAVQTTSPMTYAHVVMRAGEEVTWEPADGHTALVHVFDGALSANGHAGRSGQMLVFERSSGTIVLRAADDVIAQSAAEAGDDGVVAQALLLGGQPLGEPVVRYGPFVMNTKDEIAQAFRDYEEGTLVRSR